MPSRPSAVDRILILDFGSQVTQLIARRVRESGVYCEIWPYNADPARIAAFGARGFILSGGPASVTEGAAPRAPDIVFAAGVPVLGICYGEQTMCAELGGEVAGGEHREFGRAFIDITGDCALFAGVWTRGGREQVWMSHGDRVVRLPPGFRAVATSEGAPFAAIADDIDEGAAEFAMVTPRDRAAELGAHRLFAIANPEHRHTGVEDDVWRPRRRPLGDARRAAGEDKTARPESVDSCRIGIIRPDFAIDAAFTHPPRDELRHLAAEIEDQDAVQAGGNGLHRAPFDHGAARKGVGAHLITLGVCRMTTPPASLRTRGALS